MSMANQCDRCGVLYKQALGCLTLGEVCVANGKEEGSMNTWEDADFCEACSVEILKLIGPALNDLDKG